MKNFSFFILEQVVCDYQKTLTATAKTSSADSPRNPCSVSSSCLWRIRRHQGWMLPPSDSTDVMHCDWPEKQKSVIQTQQELTWPGPLLREYEKCIFRSTPQTCSSVSGAGPLLNYWSTPRRRHMDDTKPCFHIKDKLETWQPVIDDQLQVANEWSTNQQSLPETNPVIRITMG